MAETSKLHSGERLPTAPGVVAIANDGLSIDEAEIPNHEWRYYVLTQQQTGHSVAALLPNSADLPVPDYFTNQFYDFYPVVGISYEQAQVSAAGGAR